MNTIAKKETVGLALVIGAVQILVIVTSLILGATPGRACIMALLSSASVLVIKTTLRLVWYKNPAWLGTVSALVAFFIAAILHTLSDASLIELIGLLGTSGTVVIFLSFVNALDLESLLHSGKDRTAALFSILLMPQAVLVILLIPSVVLFSV